MLGRCKPRRCATSSLAASIHAALAKPACTRQRHTHTGPKHLNRQLATKEAHHYVVRRCAWDLVPASPRRQLVRRAAGAIAIRCRIVFCSLPYLTCTSSRLSACELAWRTITWSPRPRRHVYDACRKVHRDRRNTQSSDSCTVEAPEADMLMLELVSVATVCVYACVSDKQQSLRM